MILRGAAAAQLLAALHAGCFEAGERWDQAAMGALLATPGCIACVMGADGDGSAPAGLGLARVAADEAELLTIGVLPEARRRGVGRLVLDQLTDAVRGQGAARLFLEVSVGNAPALGFYRSRGFDEAGRRRRYYPDGSDALVLVSAV